MSNAGEKAVCYPKYVSQNTFKGHMNREGGLVE